MDRRAFLGTLALLAAPRAAEAQQAGRVYRIGMLSDGPPQTQEQRAQSPFVKELKALGWVEGGNVTFEDRRSTSVEQLDSLATDLVTLKVDVIYTGGTPAIRAAKRATRSIPIPIVMLVGVDPVSDGLVTSLPRPGGNITGITAFSSQLIEKRLGLIKQVVRRDSRIAYMWNPSNPGNVSAWEETKKVARTIGVTVQPVPVRDADELDGAFARMRKERVGGLLVGADGMLVAHRTRLADLALKYHLPTMYSFREHAEAGGLMVYSADWDALRRRAAAYVDKILRGAHARQPSGRATHHVRVGPQT